MSARSEDKYRTASTDSVCFSTFDEAIDEDFFDREMKRILRIIGVKRSSSPKDETGGWQRFDTVGESMREKSAIAEL